MDALMRDGRFRSAIHSRTFDALEYFTKDSQVAENLFKSPIITLETLRTLMMTDANAHPHLLNFILERGWGTPTQKIKIVVQNFYQLLSLSEQSSALRIFRQNSPSLLNSFSNIKRHFQAWTNLIKGHSMEEFSNLLMNKPSDDSFVCA